MTIDKTDKLFAIANAGGQLLMKPRDGQMLLYPWREFAERERRGEEIVVEVTVSWSVPIGCGFYAVPERGHA